MNIMIGSRTVAPKASIIFFRPCKNSILTNLLSKKGENRDEQKMRIGAKAYIFRQGTIENLLSPVQENRAAKDSHFIKPVRQATNPGG
jgi:hypothetical protein